MKTCVFTGHLGCGDMLTMNGAVRKLLLDYEKIIVVCKKAYTETVRQMYSDENKIEIYPIEKDYGAVADKNDIIYSNNNYEYKFIGFNDVKTFNEPNIPFFILFYKQLGFDYTDKVKYEKINRNYLIEDEIYKKFKKVYGEKYIFTHDHKGAINHYNNRTFINVKDNINNLPIFHPNINYYEDITIENREQFLSLWSEKWNSTVYNSILNYCKIIENATEIHIRDSCFSCLCPFLDLSKVKRKVVYSYDLDKPTWIKYSNIYEDWEVVYA